MKFWNKKYNSLKIEKKNHAKLSNIEKKINHILKHAI